MYIVTTDIQEHNMYNVHGGGAKDRTTAPSELFAARRLATAAAMEGPDKLIDRETNAPAGWGREVNGMVDSRVIEAGVGGD